MKPLTDDAGRPLMVVRPDDPAEAVKRAQAALKANDSEALSAIVADLPHVFVGFYGEDKRSVLDEAGNVLGTIKPGDSFITMPEQDA